MREGLLWSTAGCLAAMLLFAALVLRPHAPYEFGGCSDDSEYFLLARSIVRGEPYGVNIGPEPAAAPPYPFGLPLLLVPFVVSSPDDPGAGKAIGFTATLLNMALLIWGWPLLSRLRSRAWAVAAAMLYALSPAVVIEAQMLTADSVFTTIALLAFLICERCVRRGRVGPLAGIALGFCMALALFTRTAGLALWPALLLRLWWLRPARSVAGAAALAAGVALLLVPVLTLTSIRAADLFPSGYAASFRDPTRRGHDPAEVSLRVRSERGLSAYSTGVLREAIVPVGGGESEAAFGQRFGVPQLPAITGLTVAILIAVGAVWSAGGALAPSILLFELFHFGVLLLWHYRSPRLLYPLLPFLMLQFLWGARATARGLLRLTAGRPRWLPHAALSAALLVAASASAYKTLRNTNLQTRQVIRDFREGTTWLRENSPPQAVVLADEPETIHLYSGRPVVPLEPLGSEAALEQVLQRSAVRYILLAPQLAWDDKGTRHYDPHTATVLVPLLESLAARGRLTLVYQSPPAELVRVYRVEP